MQVAELLKLYRLQQGDVMQTVAFQLYVTNVVQSCGIAKLLRALFNLHRQEQQAFLKQVTAQAVCRTEKDEAGWKSLCARLPEHVLH